MLCYVMDAESNEWRRKTRYTYALNRVALVWGEQKDTWHTYAPHENSIRKRVADTEWQKTIMMTAAAVQQAIINNNCIHIFFFVVFCVYCSLSLAVHFVSVSGDRHPGISFFLVCKPLAILIWLAHFIRFSIFFLFSDEMHVIFVAQCIHTYTKFIIAHNTYSTLFNLLVTS